MEEQEKEPGYLGRVEKPGIIWNGSQCIISRTLSCHGLEASRLTINLRGKKSGRDIYLSYCKAHIVKIFSNEVPGSLTFSNCEFDYLEINVGAINHLNFTDCKFHTIEISGDTQLGDSLTSNNIKFTSFIPSNLGYIYLNNIEVKVLLSVDNICCTSYKLWNVKSFNNFEISCTIISELYMHTSKFMNMAGIDSSTIINKFEIVECEFDDLYFGNGFNNLKEKPWKDLPILETRQENRLIVNKIQSTKLLHFHCSSKTQKVDIKILTVTNRYINLLLENFESKSLITRGTVDPSGYIELKNINLNKVDLTNYEGNLKLTNCFVDVRGEFVLDSCFLYTIDITSTDLSKCKSISYVDLKIRNLTLLGSFWFSAKYLTQSPGNDITSIEKRSQLFRVIRMALDGQGDKVNGVQFRILEMNFLRLGLSYRNKWIPWWKFNYLIDPSWLVLQSGRTNNYGTSWSKPTWFLLGFLAVFHLIFWRYEHSHWSLNFSETWPTIGLWVQDYFRHGLQLLNPFEGPTHFYNLKHWMPEEGFTEVRWKAWPLYIALFLYRIVLAFFVYQIITGFRRLVKYEE